MIQIHGHVTPNKVYTVVDGLHHSDGYYFVGAILDGMLVPLWTCTVSKTIFTCRCSCFDLYPPYYSFLCDEAPISLLIVATGKQAQLLHQRFSR